MLDDITAHLYYILLYLQECEPATKYETSQKKKKAKYKMDPQTQVDLSKLSDADKKELNQFLTQEAQKTNIQQSMYSPTCPRGRG